MPLDEAVSLEEGVLLLDTIGVPTHALRKAKAEEAEAVAVFGCGPIGLGSISVLKAFSVPRIYAVDIVKYRLSLTSKLVALWIKFKNDINFFFTIFFTRL